MFPNYNKSILNLITSILKSYGVKTKYPSLDLLDKELLKKYKNVIVMIYDGLGQTLLNHALAKNSFLRSNVVDTITSVYPTTTAAAMNTYYSGLPPICHGWLGWTAYFKEYDKVIEYFTNCDAYSRIKLDTKEPVSNLVAYKKIDEQIKEATNGEVTTYIPPAPFEENGMKDFNELCNAVINQVKKPGRQFVFGYWPDPDHLSHLKSPYSGEVYKLISKMNKDTISFYKSLPEDTLLIISADHGHIPYEGAIYINELEDMADLLLHPLSLDQRTSSVFLKPGTNDKFISLFNKYLSKEFSIYSKEEVLKMELFGPVLEGYKIHPKSLDFIGDYIIVATGNKCLRQRTSDYKEPNMIGVHSGTTPAETLVPLIMLSK
ncbi:MAG: alkaline phosphatase family protein [Alphaproteobacteria bacterium]|nr:alkaline phosphatase family protein [Alphaproteobacteria bacterium]